MLGLLAAACLAACAPSAVIRNDDRTFQAAQARYRRTLVNLDRLAPRVEEPAIEPLPDEALFDQAEAFYHYRFAIRRPTASSYLAQAVAAFIEFTPLNVLAASQGITDLRLAAYNGAVQLYETLLQQYPATPLAPLTLYRLGWAYRNVSIGGLPRDSDAAFADLVRSAPSSPLATLATEARSLPYKTQDAAVAWSILPGAGQMYAGEWGNGAVRLTIAAGFGAAAILPPIFMLRNRAVSWPGVAISLAGITGLEVSYTVAYEDAERAALEFNERVEDFFDAAHPSAP